MMRFVSAVLVVAAAAAAQFSSYVAPASSAASGAVACGFVAALQAHSVPNSTQLHFSLDAPMMTGMPVAAQLPDGTVVRCRDDAGGALTGVPRNVVAVAHAGDQGLGSTGGVMLARPDMLEFEFPGDVGHFGVHVYELESLRTDAGWLRAYDASDALLYEAQIRYPNGSDGDNGEIHFVGLVSTQAIIRKVTLTVGNADGLPADGENDQNLEILDLYCGTAKALPGRLSTTFANDNLGSVGGAVYFELQCTSPAGVTIDALDLNFGETAGTIGAVDVYGGLGDFGWGGPLASGSATAAGPGLPTHVDLIPDLQLGAGCTLRIAVVANGLSHCYTTGDGILPQVYGNSALTLTAGEASNVPLTAPFFSPRIPNVRLHQSAGGNCPVLATVSNVGQGYAVEASSFFERLPAAQFDLDGGGLLMAPDPGNDGVAFVHVPAVTMLPFSNAVANRLPLGNDEQVAVAALPGFVLPLVVGANGWVAEGGGNSNAGTPSVAVMLGNPARGYYSWKDLDPAASGGGRVYYEEQFFGPFGRALVTFDGVYGRGTTDANSLQFVCDFVATASGYELLQVEIVWGTMAASGTPVLVGWSPAGASVTPPPRDLSAATSITQTDATERTVTLEPIGRPVQGASAVPFEVTVSELPVPGVLHMGLVGLLSPGAPLDFLGMQGCTLYTTLDVFVGPVFVAGSSVTWSPLELPALPLSLAGIEFYVQSAILGTGENAAFGVGAVTSNGLKCRVESQ